MIKKIYRLKEKEVKKVLQKAKPFFSYGLVLKKIKNREKNNRFAIVIWGKSAKTNIIRVFFRRKFYNFIQNRFLWNIDNKTNDSYDYVFVVKKQTKLEKTEEKSIKSFDTDLNFLIKNKWKKY